MIESISITVAVTHIIMFFHTTIFLIVEIANDRT